MLCNMLLAGIFFRSNAFLTSQSCADSPDLTISPGAIPFGDYILKSILLLLNNELIEAILFVSYSIFRTISVNFCVL